MNSLDAVVNLDLHQKTKRSRIATSAGSSGPKDQKTKISRIATSAGSSGPKDQPMISHVPLGYTTVRYQGRAYGLRRTDFNAGRSSKVYAKELGGTDFISFNY